MTDTPARDVRYWHHEGECAAADAALARVRELEDENARLQRMVRALCDEMDDSEYGMGAWAADIRAALGSTGTPEADR